MKTNEENFINREELLASYRNHYSEHPRLLARAPGRVNLLGEHVDYNEGPVLPAAIDRAVRLAAAPHSTRTVHLHAVDL